MPSEMNFSALPIAQVLPQLSETLTAHRCVILSAEPGAGKTTAVPLALLRQSWLNGKKILLLEPRRLAAISAADYMAKLIGEQVGQTIGYRVRHESRVSNKTRIEILTEGLLLRRLLTDPTLEAAGLVIFDEFHERNAEADLALSFLKATAELRHDLKILVMSATLDTQKLSEFLSAPVLFCSGRIYPVEVKYARDLGIEATNYVAPYGNLNENFYRDIAKAMRQALNETPGDILTFLPGAGEINRLREYFYSEQAQVAILHGSLSREEQQQALQYHPQQRKIILATNIAETSLTLEGITAVVDSGFARFLRYDPASELEVLTLERIALDSAKQRQGRAGRTTAGICYKLWHKEEERGFATTTQPALLQGDPVSAVLHILALGFRPQSFELLDPLPAATLTTAIALLYALGACNKEGQQITDFGRQMAELPLHPRLAAMVLRHPTHDTLALAALLQERDILREAETVDVRLRLRLLSQGQGERETIRRINKSIEQLERLVKIQNKGGDVAAAAATAYPDRIGRRRSQAGFYTLSGGRGAKLPSGDPLCEEEWLVALSLDGRGENAKIRLAIDYSEEQLRTAFAQDITEDPIRHEENGKITFYREERFRAIILRRIKLSNQHLSDEEWAEIWLAQFIKGQLPLDAASEKLRRRAEILQRINMFERDVSLSTLFKQAEDWLKPFLYGVQNLTAAQERLQQALRSLFSREDMNLLNQELPEYLILPTGSKAYFDYSGDIPHIEIKLQELFGVKNLPPLAGGKIKPRIHLLSPARRPVQVTDDLMSFWQNTYPEVRKELRGRYPKHSWPEDPLAAKPTKK